MNQTPTPSFTYRTTTMTFTTLMTAMSIVAALSMPSFAQAGDGHDHGNSNSNVGTAANGQPTPRFTAVSEAFELVGVLQGKQITLYLDRAADNAPVTDAQIELEIGGNKLKAVKHDDTFEVTLAARPQPGVLPITVTVTAGKEADLLVGELDLHEEAHTEKLAAQTVGVRSWKDLVGWAAAAMLALVALILIGRRGSAGRQHTSKGSV